METKLTAEDAKKSLTAHVTEKGFEIHEKYGPVIGWSELLRILDDRTACRYSCELSFDPGPLEEGEIAYPAPKGERPEEGFTIHVHPTLESQRERVPHAVLYQLVQVNYGDFASPEDAEVFGAAALGLPKDDYYAILCSMADEICGCGHGNCRCSAQTGVDRSTHD